MYLLTAIAKLPQIKSYIRELLAGEGKFLVFAHHICVLDGLSELCESVGVEYIRIDGGTPMVQRQVCVCIYILFF